MNILLIDIGTSSTNNGSEQLGQSLAASHYSVVHWNTDSTPLTQLIEQSTIDAIVLHEAKVESQTLEQIKGLTAIKPLPVLLFVEQASSEQIADAHQRGVYLFASPLPVHPVLLSSIISWTVQQWSDSQSNQQQLQRLQQRLTDRETIDRAKCKIMEQLQLSEAEAYAQMRRAAMDQRQALAEIAQTVIDLPITALVTPSKTAALSH